MSRIYFPKYLQARQGICIIRLMDTYCPAKQELRFNALHRLAENVNLSHDVRRMWAHKRDRLAQNETQYNERMREIYANTVRELYV